jgi:hypothetical protein
MLFLYIARLHKSQRYLGRPTDIQHMILKNTNMQIAGFTLNKS